jgi:hypothetical protein
MSDHETESMASAKTSGPLQLLENIAVVGSICGAVAAHLTKEILFAATPLSAALLLNLINRRRLEQINLQNGQTMIHQIQEVSGQIRALQDRPSQPVAALNSQDPEISQRIESSLVAIGGSIEQLQDRLSTLELAQPDQYQTQMLAADPLVGSMAPSAVDPEQLNSEISRRVEPLEQRLQALAAYLEQGAPAPAGMTSDADANTVEMMKLQMQVQYTDLEASMNHVLEQLQQLPAASQLQQWASHLTELSNAVDASQSRLAVLETAQGDVAVSPASAVQVDLSEYQAQLQSGLSGFEQKLQGLEAAVANVSVNAHSSQGLGDLEPQLRQLMEQVEAQLGQFEAKFAEVQSTLAPAAAVQTQQFEQNQQGKLADLQQHLQNLELKLDMSLSDLKADLKRVPALIDASVQNQSAQLQPLQPTAAANNGSVDPDDLQSLDALLQELG